MGKAIIIGIGVVLTANFLALSFNWYENFTLFDNILHIAGGFLMAMLFFWFFNPARLQASGFNKAVLAVSFAALIGVLWEFAEITFLNYLVAHFFDRVNVEVTLSDTLSDLFLDLVGAVAFIAVRYVGYSKINNKHEIHY